MLMHEKPCLIPILIQSTVFNDAQADLGLLFAYARRRPGLFILRQRMGDNESLCAMNGTLFSHKLNSTSSGI